MLHPSCSASSELPPPSPNHFTCTEVFLENYWLTGKPPGAKAVSKLILACHQHPKSDSANQDKQSKGGISNNIFAGLNTKKQTKALESIKIIPLCHSHKHLLSTLRRPKKKLERCAAKLKPLRNHTMRTAETLKTG